MVRARACRPEGRDRQPRHWAGTRSRAVPLAAVPRPANVNPQVVASKVLVISAAPLSAPDSERRIGMLPAMVAHPPTRRTSPRFALRRLTDPPVGRPPRGLLPSGPFASAFARLPL